MCLEHAVDIVESRCVSVVSFFINADRGLAKLHSLKTSRI